MRVVTLQLRSLALLLVALWSVAAVVSLAAYRGNRFDLLVAAAAFVPAVVAAIALACPPVTGGHRASVA
ncbi:MAG: hypothetical protein M3301_03545, partial [Chloroflexota bacterium]|nr:hypothetical protein [Chloroflexota bacterium]